MAAAVATFYLSDSDSDLSDTENTFGLPLTHVPRLDMRKRPAPPSKKVSSFRNFVMVPRSRPRRRAADKPQRLSLKLREKTLPKSVVDYPEVALDSLPAAMPRSVHRMQEVEDVDAPYEGIDAEEAAEKESEPAFTSLSSGIKLNQVKIHMDPSWSIVHKLMQSTIISKILRFNDPHTELTFDYSFLDFTYTSRVTFTPETDRTMFIQICEIGVGAPDLYTRLTHALDWEMDLLDAVKARAEYLIRLAHLEDEGGDGDWKS